MRAVCLPLMTQYVQSQLCQVLWGCARCQSGACMLTAFLCYLRRREQHSVVVPLCGWAPSHWVGGGRPLPGAPSPPGGSLLT